MKPLDQDRLRPVLGTLDKLERVGAWGGQPWRSDLWDDLPGDQMERDMLRHIERFPYSYERFSQLAVSLRLLSKHAGEWLPDCRTPGQKALAAGVAMILRSSLEILGLP